MNTTVLKKPATAFGSKDSGSFPAAAERHGELVLFKWLGLLPSKSSLSPSP